jgi:hypothetical protein
MDRLRGACRRCVAKRLPIAPRPRALPAQRCGLRPFDDSACRRRNARKRPHRRVLPRCARPGRGGRPGHQLVHKDLREARFGRPAYGSAAARAITTMRPAALRQQAPGNGCRFRVVSALWRRSGAAVGLRLHRRRRQARSNERFLRSAIFATSRRTPAPWVDRSLVLEVAAVCNGSAVPIRRREQRTVDGALASTSIERLLSGFRPRERTTAYVCSTA